MCSLLKIDASYLQNSFIVSSICIVQDKTYQNFLRNLTEKNKTTCQGESIKTMLGREMEGKHVDGLLLAEKR